MKWSHSPLGVSFFVLIIFAANSSPVAFCTHRRTTEKAPLKHHKSKKISFLSLSLRASYCSKCTVAAKTYK